MATAFKATSSNKKIRLMGPAQIEFKTFMEQCIYFANLYWPDWKNYENPASYIIPRVFSYVHPDVSDEVTEIVYQQETLRDAAGKGKRPRDRFLTDRETDTAEHLVYTALQYLIEEKIRAPLIVVHNLNIHDNQKLISHLFPIVDEQPLRASFEKCRREYDFLIISPYIGIVAIEAKSSQFTAGRDFSETNKYLPKSYFEGLQQLESVDALFQVLSACANSDVTQNTPIRKVLFTPNLKRQRYESWKDSIGDAAPQNVEPRTKDVIQWFAEDLDNYAEYSAKPPLYSTLRDVLETTSVGIPTEIAEKYALLVSGLRSMIRFGGANVGLSTMHFSQNEAILAEHQRIERQDPFEGQKYSRISEHHSLLKRIDRTKLDYEPKLFFLSPDQQAVLEGPANQFIIGAAGTGKTVILQAKALQLLSEGETVVVFSPKCYREQYEKLFDSYGFKNYQCLAWPYKGFERLHIHFDSYSKDAQRCKDAYFTREVIRRIYECIKQDSISETLDWLIGKNVFIDDVCDGPPWDLDVSFDSAEHLFVAWSVMAFIGVICPTKVTWTALDPSISDFSFIVNSASRPLIFRTTMEGLLSNGLEHGGVETFCVSTLKRVMRCSESVYRTAYSRDHKLRWINGMKPILAHKMQGLVTCELFESSTYQDATGRLHDLVKDTLIRLSREGIDMANVAVILGYCPAVLADKSNLNASIKIATGSCPVYRYQEVSSMEWPIVIYATCLEEDLLENISNDEKLYLVAYSRYRAMTRATTRLIDITVTYKRPDWADQDGDRCSDVKADHRNRRGPVAEPAVKGKVSAIACYFRRKFSKLGQRTT